MKSSVQSAEGRVDPAADAPARAEGDAPFSEDDLYVNVRDEVYQLNDCYTLAVRVLRSLLPDVAPGQVNAGELMDELDTQEKSMFSTIPAYVRTALEHEDERLDKRRRSSHAVSQYHAEPTPSTATRFRRNSRAYVDPSNPLPLPYNHAKRKSVTKEGSTAHSTLHDYIHNKNTLAPATVPSNNERASIRQVAQPPEPYAPDSPKKLETAPVALA